MQPRKGDHINGELSQVSVKLAGESEAGGNAAQSRADEVVEITIGWRGQLEGPEADIVERLVVYAIRLVRVLHQLMHREGAVVGLDHGVRYLRKEARIDVQGMGRGIGRARVSRPPCVYTSGRIQALYASNARGIVLLTTKGRFLAGALFRIHCTLSRAHRKDFRATPRG